MFWTVVGCCPVPWRMPNSLRSPHTLDAACTHHQKCLMGCAVLSRSVVSDSLQPCGLQPARLFCPCGFSRQEYWSGLSCPPPEDLPNSGSEPRSPSLQADSLLSSYQVFGCCLATSGSGGKRATVEDHCSEVDHSAHIL